MPTMAVPTSESVQPTLRDTGLSIVRVGEGAEFSTACEAIESDLSAAGLSDVIHIRYPEYKGRRPRFQLTSPDDVRNSHTLQKVPTRLAVQEVSQAVPYLATDITV